MSTRRQAHFFYRFFACLLAFGAISGMGILTARARSSFSFLFIPLFLLLAQGNLRFGGMPHTKTKKAVWAFAFAFSFAFCAGSCLTANGSMGGACGLLVSLCTGLCFSPAAAFGAWWAARALSRSISRCDVQAGQSPRKMFWVYFAVLLLCWLPVFLAYYPGLFAYDIDSQTNQVLTGQYTTHHPLIHTLLQGLFYSLGGLLGSHTVGMALHTGFQAICMALSMAYALWYVYMLQAPRCLRVIALLFFSVCPMVSILTLSLTKDILFSALFLALCVRLHQLYQNPALLKRFSFTGWLVVKAALFCMFRNNGVIVLVMGMLLCVLCFRAFPYRARFLGIIGCALALFAVGTLGLRAAPMPSPVT